jgi:hypothetical protein
MSVTPLSDDEISALLHDLDQMELARLAEHLARWQRLVALRAVQIKMPYSPLSQPWAMPPKHQRN